MGRSRYKIYEPTHPHFLTCTVLHWLPLFTNQESVQIIIDSLNHLQKNDNMIIFSYVILENHLHLVASSDDISKTMQKFKSYTAYELLKLLEKNNATTLLKQFAFHKKAHRKENSYQIWEEGFHPKLIQSEKMMFEKVNYIHQNPVKRGYIDEAEHWRYSSARDYSGVDGLLEVERLW
ncbi:MAG TPA: transposase [Epsilonproteobacteria bacterium]|nr:transposase [Campylobacterota bacterium]